MTQEEYISEIKERLATQDALIKLYAELLEKSNKICMLLIERSKKST